jgi:hypothetical protein
MVSREPLMTADFFDSEIAYTEKTIKERLRKLQEQPTVYTKPKIFFYANFRDSYELIFLEYCRGESFHTMKSRFLPALSAWEHYLAAADCEVNDFARYR